MPILAALVFIIQFCFAFHALKTGRPYWWIFIIMGFPVMGSIIYYFVEVFPGSKEHRSAFKAARKLAKSLAPDADLKRRVEELDVCGSVENKMALAEECMNQQMYPEAERLYASCLSGVFQNDGAILYCLAKAAVENRNWSKASETIARLRSVASEMRVNDVRLLDARVLEGQGENDAALMAYRELLPVYVGLEARYRYGALLARLGQQESALQIFNDLIRHAKRAPSPIEEEQQWANAARRAISGAEPKT